MQNILVIGARGYGREICGGLMVSSLVLNKEFTIKGFLDDKKTALDGFNGFPPIVSSVENYRIEKDDIFVCALGDSRAREKYINIIKNKDGSFLTCISPNAIVSKTARIGEGVIIGQFCTISENVSIGSFSVIHSYSTFGHDSQVGDFCSVGAYSFLGGYARINNYTTLHPRSTILPRVSLGDEVVVGAGSVVIRNVKPGITVFGIPAKKITF